MAGINKIVFLTQQTQVGTNNILPLNKQKIEINFKTQTNDNTATPWYACHLSDKKVETLSGGSKTAPKSKTDKKETSTEASTNSYDWGNYITTDTIKNSKVYNGIIKEVMDTKGMDKATATKYVDKMVDENHEKTRKKMNASYVSDLDHYNNDVASNGLKYEEAYNIITEIANKHMAQETHQKSGKYPTSPSSNMSGKYSSAGAYIPPRPIDTILGNICLTLEEKRLLVKAIKAIDELECRHEGIADIAGYRYGFHYTLPWDKELAKAYNLTDYSKRL